MDTLGTLDAHLAACANATGLRMVTGAVPVETFANAIQNDAALRGQAKSALASIDPRVAQRDHVMRWKMKILQHVLTGAS